MTRLIHCAKLNKEAEGLTQPPLPGEFGKKIYDQISKEAVNVANPSNHATNEYRLSMIDPKSVVFLMQEMDSFCSDPVVISRRGLYRCAKLQ